MRKYQPIWQLLKSDGVCRLKAPRAFHARIIKGVTKEKYQDITFKVEEEERQLTLKTEQGDKEAEPDLLIFYLHKSISVQDL